MPQHARGDLLGGDDREDVFEKFVVVVFVRQRERDAVVEIVEVVAVPAPLHDAKRHRVRLLPHDRVGPRAPDDALRVVHDARRRDGPRARGGRADGDDVVRVIVVVVVVVLPPPPPPPPLEPHDARQRQPAAETAETVVVVAVVPPPVRAHAAVDAHDGDDALVARRGDAVGRAEVDP
eukprot:29041-Pelagococcus_subviridis.AAC.3